MLQVRASPTFLPSTSSSSPSSAQAPTPSASFGRGSHRRGGLVSFAAAASPHRGAARRPVMAAAGAAKLEDADALIDSVETFIFDCDGECGIDFFFGGVAFRLNSRVLFVCRAGVIWKGDKLIDGVPETLDLLRSKVRPKPQCSS
jgi:phosphoglycolate phosphatase